MSTKIQWTNKVWNPTTGCNKVSPGCKFCYAEVMHKRLTGMGTVGYERPFLAGAFPNPDALPRPLKWKKPCKVFVNSMSDLFHANIPFDYIDKVFAIMALTPQHTYQILTKRPDRMAEYLNGAKQRVNNSKNYDIPTGTWIDPSPDGPQMPWPLPNVWLGTSVENQKEADERIPHLLNCPAAVRFLSCEPLLGVVDFSKIPEKVDEDDRFAKRILHGIDWVITGGESGSKARPMHPDWARGLRDQCERAGVAFFFKQWGAYGTDFQLPNGTPTHFQFHSFQNWVNKAGTWMRGNICVDTQGRVLNIGADFMKARDENAFPVVLLKKMGKAKSGRLLDGVEHNAYPTTTANKVVDIQQSHAPVTPKEWFEETICMGMEVKYGTNQFSDTAVVQILEKYDEHIKSTSLTTAPFTETHNADHRTPCGQNYLPQ